MGYIKDMYTTMFGRNGVGIKDSMIVGTDNYKVGIRLTNYFYDVKIVLMGEDQDLSTTIITHILSQYGITFHINCTGQYPVITFSTLMSNKDKLDNILDALSVELV